MGDYTVRVVLGVVRNLALPVLSEISFTERYLMDIHFLQQKTFLYNSKLLPVLQLRNLT